MRRRVFTMDVAQRRDGEWIIVERGYLSRPVPDKATSQQARAKLKKLCSVVNTYLD